MLAGFLSSGLAITNANAAVVTLADYLVAPNLGDNWTYITTIDSYWDFPTPVSYPAGTEFTVTEPWYVSYDLLPAVAETGLPILVEPPNISIIIDIIPELTVPAGTFTDVLMMAALDSNFTANPINDLLGINPLIDEGVTDVDWFALGVGQIKFMGVNASDGGIHAEYELISYSVNSVPIPATVWLFGSGLTGLIGIARRKKA